LRYHINYTDEQKKYILDLIVAKQAIHAAKVAELQFECPSLLCEQREEIWNILNLKQIALDLAFDWKEDLEGNSTSQGGNAIENAEINFSNAMESVGFTITWDKSQRIFT